MAICLGAPIAVLEGDNIYFVRSDHIGRPVLAADEAGTTVWTASWLPFGGVHVENGVIDARFPGQWFQAESGLHQNWMRDYDPTTGRYIEADPLGLVDGPSVYNYASSNPMRYNRTVRGEWLGQFIFETIEEAQDQATEWLWTYNNERPNMGIGGMTPAMKLKAAA